MKCLAMVLLALLLPAIPARADWASKLVVWERGEKAITAQVLFTQEKEARAIILDLAPDAKEEDALKRAEALFADQLAGEAAALIPPPVPIDWQAVTLAIVAEVEAKDKNVKIDLAAAVEGKPAVTVTAAVVPIEEPIEP